MEVINVTDAMDKELKRKQAFNHERVGYLKFTKNYYLLENDTERVMTDEPVTLIQLQAKMTLTPYSAATLDETEAEEAIKKKPKARKAPAKKTTQKKDAKKETTKEKSESKEDTSGEKSE